MRIARLKVICASARIINFIAFGECNSYKVRLCDILFKEQKRLMAFFVE